jgi:hypothetical protein
MSVTGMNPGLLAWERVQSGVALRLPPRSMTLRVVFTKVEFQTHCGVLVEEDWPTRHEPMKKGCSVVETGTAFGLWEDLSL